ncbi:MAG: endo-1,4-beta-xylanase [Ferruginibacter sp.]|nr:endo-1,4-beta-xylanase [Ferruginibacter sp.]
MKNYLIVLCLAICFNAAVTAQRPEPLKEELRSHGPVSIFPENAQKEYVFNNKNPGVPPATFEATTRINSLPVFIAENFVPSKSNADIQASWKSTAAVKKGDVLLARFAMRAVYAKQESGDAVVYFFVQQSVAPRERILWMEISIGPEWKTFDIPFVALFDMEAGEAAIGFTFGALAQKVEIAEVTVLNFQQKITVQQLPAARLTYAGRDKDAAWRKEALQRIEAIRTAPLAIEVKDHTGKPVKGAVVKARLINPVFVFGTAVSVNRINDTGRDAVQYRTKLKELFNAVTIDNNLKWGPWIDVEKREATKVAIKWIVDNGFALRGHNLVWPGKKFTPSFYAKQPGFGPGFADSINKHIEEIVAYTKGKVYGWDVVNEMMHEKDYFEVIPRTQAAEWFKLARRIDPNTTLFINEYSMLNNVASPQNIQTYLNLVTELRGYGAPIDAIGVQGHVGRQPRNPAQVITDLDMFTSTGLPVQITEFDINSPDEALQADYTRDFLIACYSHPNVNGFTMWGFWESAHWKPDAAMFKKDWTAKPNLAAWKELVLNRWRTNISETSKANGKVTARGHLGLYEITVSKGGAEVKMNYQLTKNSMPAVVQL